MRTESFEGLANFLVKGNLAGTAAKPSLFCDSTWLEPQALADTVRDTKGKEVYVNKKPRTIQESYTKFTDYGVDFTMLPFWSSDLMAYVFAHAGEGNTICTTVADLQGVTATLLKAGTGNIEFRAATLCPRAFTNTAYYTLLPTSGLAMKDVKGRDFDGKTTLATVLPRSTTLFHEALHVTEGRDFLGAGVEECKINPEHGKWMTPF